MAGGTHGVADDDRLILPKLMESNPQGGGMDVEPVADQLGAHAAAAGIVEHSAHHARTPMGQALWALYRWVTWRTPQPMAAQACS